MPKLSNILLAGSPLVQLALMSNAYDFPKPYRCNVQSNIGGSSVMEDVDTIIIDEVEKSVRFYTGNRDAGATPIVGRHSEFHTFSSGFFAFSGNLLPAQVFAFNRTTGLATHTYTLPEVASAITWKCASPDVLLLK